MKPLRPTVFAVVACGWMLASGQSGHAESADSEFRPVTEMQLAMAAEETLTTVRAVESELRRTTAGSTWVTYLELSALHHELHSAADVAPTRGQATAVQTTLGRLVGLHSGLEMPPLMRLRRALRKYDAMHYLYRNDAASATQFATAMQTIQQQLAESTPYDLANRYRLADPHLVWLNRYGQADRIVNRFRQEWSKPNLWIDISRDAVLKVTERSVREVTPIAENKDGRRITGRAVATGTAYLIPVTSNSIPGQPCQVVFQGQIHSTLNGRQGPVSFRLVGQTQLFVQRPVNLSLSRFHGLPSELSTCTSIRTDRICTRRNGPLARGVRRIAGRLIEKERPSAERDLNRTAARKFVDQFESEINLELAQAEADFRNDVLLPLDRIDLRPSDAWFLGSAQQLRIAVRLDAETGVAAPSVPANIRRDQDVTLSVHESAINRVAGRLLSGEEIVDLQQLANQFGFELPDEASTQLPMDVAVQFARQQPLTVRLEDDCIEVTVRGDRFRLGQYRLVAMHAIVRYRIVVDPNGVRLVLDGAPRVVRPPVGRSLRFYTQRNVLQRRLQRDLPAEIELDPIRLPEPANSLGSLQTTFARAAAGWLQVALHADQPGETPGE